MQEILLINLTADILCKQWTLDILNLCPKTHMLDQQLHVFTCDTHEAPNYTKGPKVKPQGAVEKRNYFEKSNQKKKEKKSVLA